MTATVPSPATPARPPEALVMLRLHAAVSGVRLLTWGLLLFACLLALNLSQRGAPPAHALGMLMILTGAGHLIRRMPRGSLVRHRAVGVLVCAALTTYFIPFLQWWRATPYHVYFAWNALGFWLATAALLYQLNSLVFVFGNLREDDHLVQHAALGRLLAIALPLPLLVLAVGAALYAVRHHAPVVGQVVTDVRHAPVWARVVMLIPFTTTLHALYKTGQMFETDLETRAKGHAATEKPS